MLLRATEVTGEAQQFIEESTARGIRGMIAQFASQRLNCFLQLAGLKKLSGSHLEAYRLS